MSDCVFCKIVNNEIPSDKVFENDHVMAFLDIAPSSPGHTLVIPKEHYADLTETPDNVLAELSKTVKKIGPKIVSAVDAKGFNLLSNIKEVAGQVIFHTHIHIIPRFEGDGLKHWPKIELSKEKIEEIKEEIIENITK
ncbi:HIT family protein [Candidatus Woesearchaeota archaeon CG10_big_fil_rev_8_21_14_0_10_37_12]|nr:MAG: HIT family protein [Candidatus Woesearchaeota archaeon CG10_big_fil_rev_8_21_14_0_10_37_12]